MTDEWQTLLQQAAEEFYDLKLKDPEMEYSEVEFRKFVMRKLCPLDSDDWSVIYFDELLID